MKSFLLTMFTMLLLPAMSFGMTEAFGKNSQFGLNRASPEAMQKYQLGTLVSRDTVHELRVVWSYAVGGGAVATQNLRTDTSTSPKLPKNGLIVGCYIDSVTTPVGAGSIALSTGKSAGDLLGATTATSISGIYACIPTGTAATSIKLTADVTPTIAISSAVLTAGKLVVHILYLLSE